MPVLPMRTPVAKLYTEENRAGDNYIETIKYILKDYITLQRDILKHQTP